MDRIALAFSPLRDASPRDVVAWSRSAEERGYEAVFIPESYCDSLAYAEAVALGTTRLGVGTAITNVYLLRKHAGPERLRRRGRAHPRGLGPARPPGGGAGRDRRPCRPRHAGGRSGALPRAARR